MEYRRLGSSGLKVPALSFGAGTFGGRGPLFGAWGNTDAREARRLVDICLEAGLTMFDTADLYSNGASEEVLGEAIKGHREQVIISTKTTLPMGDGPNDAASSRWRLIKACETALRRLKTDYIDLLQLHAFDAGTPIAEVLSALYDLLHAGKIRYVGVSNFSGWQLMKSLAIAEKHGYPRYVANQAYYSLVGRDYEWELMPLGLDRASALSCGARSAGATARPIPTSPTGARKVLRASIHPPFGRTSRTAQPRRRLDDRRHGPDRRRGVSGLHGRTNDAADRCRHNANGVVADATPSGRSRPLSEAYRTIADFPRSSKFDP
jgi:aryl-alcohol dehydrogenase-like predicted oxidoreductase